MRSELAALGAACSGGVRRRATALMRGMGAVAPPPGAWLAAAVPAGPDLGRRRAGRAGAGGRCLDVAGAGAEVDQGRSALVRRGWRKACGVEVPARQEEMALLLPCSGTQTAWKPGRRPRTDGCDRGRGWHAECGSMRSCSSCGMRRSSVVGHGLDLLSCGSLSFVGGSNSGRKPRIDSGRCRRWRRLLGVVLLPVGIMVESRQPARRERSDGLWVKALAPSGAGDGDGCVTSLL